MSIETLSPLPALLIAEENERPSVLVEDQAHPF